MISVFVWLLLASSPALAQADTEAQARDRRELRALMVTLKTAMNEGRFQDMKAYLAKGYSLTMINQDNLTDDKSIDAFLDTWFTGSARRIRRYRIEPEVSAPSILLDGKYAVAHGTAVETYDMDRGITYTFNSRWTATLAKEEGRWKVLSFHGGVSFLDNPVLNSAERWIVYGTLGGLALGVLGTFAAGSLRRRFRQDGRAAAA